MNRIATFAAIVSASASFVTAAVAQDGAFQAAAPGFPPQMTEPLLAAAAPAAVTTYTGSVSVKISGTITPAITASTKIVCSIQIITYSHGTIVGGQKVYFAAYDNASATASVSGTTYTCTVPLKYKWTDLMTGNQPGVFANVYMFDAARPSPISGVHQRSAQNVFVGYMTPSTSGATRSFTTSIGL